MPSYELTLKIRLYDEADNQTEAEEIAIDMLDEIYDSWDGIDMVSATASIISNR